ncbi:IS110 family transposase [Calidifontibacter sp. DB0510]|uniref:IS110 family transposase n=1 Tax=Metallococcus carri TaxID=1656884 RepID=A0A967B559_9MICO|nr:IS110 family transposase [Metallococcus carri]NHN57460.1 IS110 family transposase [Metallococcus carri]NOP39236.1 IS110 family transposase [Calidifontibacter sp. DB2511S]
MTIVADTYTYVVGVDTHAATHHFAVIHAATGAVIDDRAFPTTPAGLARALTWISDRAGGQVERTLISAEGTGSYGAPLAQLLHEAGYRVVEAPTPARARIRGRGKSDQADAITAARAITGMDLNTLRDRRSGGIRAALQALLARREELNDRHTTAINMLTSLLRTHALGVDARTALSAAQIHQIAHWRTRHEDRAQAILRRLAREYAREIQALATQRRANATQIHQIVTAQAPELLDLYGVGPINAAIILTVWSHPGRIRSAAAMNSIAGVAPIPIQSGNTHKVRLNRGGDRRLNKAIASIVLTRCRTPESKAYIARRVAEGKTPQEAKRCLRAYLTRKIYRVLTAAHPTPPQPDLTAA